MSRRDLLSSLRRMAQGGYAWVQQEDDSGSTSVEESEKIQREEEYKVIYLIFLLKMEIWVKKGGGMCPPPQKAYKERKNSHVQNEFLRLRIEWGRLNNSQNASPKHITQKGVQLLSCPTLAPRLAKFSQFSLFS